MEWQDGEEITSEIALEFTISPVTESTMYIKEDKLQIANTRLGGGVEGKHATCKGAPQSCYGPSSEKVTVSKPLGNEGKIKIFSDKQNLREFIYQWSFKSIILEGKTRVPEGMVNR